MPVLPSWMKCGVSREDASWGPEAVVDALWCVWRYMSRKRLLWPTPLSGNVIRMYSAWGRARYGSGSLELGEKTNFIVPSRPVVVVAAWVMFRLASKGMRNWLVQPAPRMRSITGLGDWVWSCGVFLVWVFC